jgi:hypothetical protein
VSPKYIELIEVAVVVASSTAWSTADDEKRPPIQLLLTDAERAELLARLAVRKAPADEKLRIRIACWHALKALIRRTLQWVALSGVV